MILFKSSSLILILFLFFNCQPDRESGNSAQDTSAIGTEIKTIESVNPLWAGIWEREGSIDPATLSISEVSPSSFRFHLNSNDGANLKEINGKAAIEGNMALFLLAENNDTCQVTFLLQDSLLTINQANGCKLSSEIDFSGEYFHERYIKEKVMEEDKEGRGNTFP